MTEPHGELDCYSCRQEALGERPPREEVSLGGAWRVAHAFDTSLPGWLVAVPRRHVTAFAQLDEAEASELGPLLVALGRALAEVVGCVKTYVIQFAEAEGFSHLHVHVVPRAADLAPELHGPRVFALLGRPEAERVPVAEQDRIVVELRSVLDAPVR